MKWTVDRQMWFGKKWLEQDSSTNSEDRRHQKVLELGKKIFVGTLYTAKKE